jgi:hypothetical protein
MLATPLQVLTPIQEGQLEAGSYPWCPDVWAITGAAAAHLAANSTQAAAGSGRGKGGRKGNQAAAAAAQAEQQQQQPAGGAGIFGLDEDPMAALSTGTDVLQPLMPFMTAFQLLRQPITAKGAGLRLKRECLWLVAITDTHAFCMLAHSCSRLAWNCCGYRVVPRRMFTVCQCMPVAVTVSIRLESQGQPPTSNISGVTRVRLACQSTEVPPCCCWCMVPAGALLLDPFRTVVPAAAYSQPTAAEVANMSLLDAHCGTYQQVGSASNGARHHQQHVM